MKPGEFGTEKTIYRDMSDTRDGLDAVHGSRICCNDKLWWLQMPSAE